MIRILYGFVVLCLTTVFAHALDVSVVDGQSRVTGTLNQLQSQVADLETASRTHAESLGQYFSCSRNSQLYSEQTGGCVGVVPDAAGLAVALGCANGDVIAQEGGRVACKSCPAGQMLVFNGNGTIGCKNPIDSCSCPAKQFSYSTGSGHAQTIFFNLPATNRCGRVTTVAQNVTTWILNTIPPCNRTTVRTATHTGLCTENGWETLRSYHPSNQC